MMVSLLIALNVCLSFFFLHSLISDTVRTPPPHTHIYIYIYYITGVCAIGPVVLKVALTTPHSSGKFT